LDQSSLEANRCSHCGAAVRKISQRTIEDKQNLRERLTKEQDESPEDLSSQATRLILPSDLVSHGQTIEQGHSDTAGDSADEPEAAQQSGTPSEPERHSPTVGDQSDMTMEFQPPGEESLQIEEAEESSRRSTHTVQKDATIDLDMTSSEAQTLDSQWRGTFDLAAGQGQTIRQKETVSGFRSSLPVKSRYVREKRKTAGVPPKTPADVPDYELLDIIGEGGMGVVYAAHQSSIARTVAVKMLKPSAKMREDQRDKFISEAVVTGELDHPNIVPIYDLGANDEGALFYSMKRVRGTPWDKVLHKKQLDENLSILMRVADAVAFAHAGGVIHRDLKPENVMLGDFGEVLVMDWGLARITPEFAHVDTVYQADSLGGTPAYMSPEMARGPVERINKTSDIYLLGAMLYEIIGGVPPHSGRDVMQCLMAASQNRIDPIRYDGELKEIALKAMATRQEDRYQTVKEFQAAIAIYQSHSESLVLTAHSNQNLQKARHSGDYQLFARALYGFQESLTLWDANQRAKTLLAETQRDYADSALKKGDLDLAASLLQPDQADHQPLLKKIEAARAERDARQRRLRLAKMAVAALAAGIIVTTSTGLYLVNTARQESERQRGIAEANEKEAVKQKGIAETNAQEAVRQQGIAETNANEAIRQKGIAETNAQEAIKQKGIAETNEQEAVKQRTIAEDAKKQEEYEAYVAQIGLASAKIDENAYEYALELLEDSQADLRNWEWGRLVHLCRLSTAFNADGPVQTVAYSPDGRSFATGGLTGEVAIRDATTGALKHSTKHDHAVLTIAYSPNGQQLAAGLNDGTIQIHALGDEGLPIEGREPIAWKGHADGVLTVRFSPDGEQLLTGSLDNTARLWDWASGSEIQNLIGHSWWVWAAEFSPDGNRIVTAGQDGKAIVWEKAIGSRPSAIGQTTAIRQTTDDRRQPAYTQLTEFTGHSGALYAARFSPNGDLVATGGYDNSVMIWNPDEVKPIDIKKRLLGEPEEKPNFIRLAGHDKPVRSLAFSPKGQLLVSGSDDNSVRLWDVASGAPLKALRGHSRAVRSAEFSIDGSRVLSGSEDQSVRVWDVGDYQEVRVLHATVLSGHDDAVLAARFSRDGQQIVTASRDRTASLWDAASGRPLRRFDEGHEFLISSAAFFPDGKHMATGAGDNSVRIWDLMAGTEKLELAPTGRIGTLAVSPDGSLVATGSQGTDVQVWNVQTGKVIKTLSGHAAEIASLAFSPDGQRLATGDDRGNLRVWSRGRGQAGSPGDWELELELPGHNSSVTSIRFTPDGQRLITSSGDRTCGQWDLAAGQELRELVLRHPEWVSSLDISPDGRAAITTCDDGLARLWRLADAAPLAVVRSPGKRFNWGAISPDGSTAALTSTEDKAVWLWDLSAAREAGIQSAGDFDAESGLLRQILDFNQQGGEVWMAAFAPDGRHIVTLGGNDAELWSLDSRDRIARYSSHGAVASAAISPNGRLVATGSWDHSAKIWDAETGQAIRKLEGEHSGQVNSIEFSPDGAQLLTASDDKTACLWDAETGRSTGKLTGHTGRVIAATYSPDGTRILTVSDDQTARVWERATGNLLATLKGHTRAVICGQFSADGHRVITGSRDGKAKIWDIATETMLVDLAGHTAAVTAVAFSPDDTRALTGSQDNTCKLWDAQPDKDGKEILTLPGHTQEVTAVSFSPDGRNVLTSSRDGTAVIWLAESWRNDAALQAARGQ
jgi:WD40 repeat protein/serine/threonine protein kinase